MKHQVRKLASKKAIAAIVIIIGGAGLLVSGIIFWDWYTTTHHFRLPSPTATVIHSSDKPNETPINTHAAAYTVPADQPRLIELPTLGISGFIQRVGLDQNNAIATPGNVHMAGWYTGSATPGEDGVSIIDGHVHGRYEPGIFEHLDQLKSGDPITIEYGNGDRHKFSVVKVTSYPAAEAATHMFDALPSINQELVLITCGGKFNRQNASYDQRVLVYAQ
jgi:sortase A